MRKQRLFLRKELLITLKILRLQELSQQELHLVNQLIKTLDITPPHLL